MTLSTGGVCEKEVDTIHRDREKKLRRTGERSKASRKKKSTKPTQGTEWTNPAAGEREEQRQRAVSWGGEEVRGEEKDRCGVQRIR